MKLKRSYGHLTVICGPMFSGKTTEILKRILWAKNGQKKIIRVYKPSYDTRYQRQFVVSHEGLSSPADPIEQWPEIPIDVSMVFFDEIHFFVQPHYNGTDLVEGIQKLLKEGIDVVVCGLDIDWRGMPFEITARLMAISETILKLRGVCAVCGQPSTRSYKKSQEGGGFELGAQGIYEPRCTHHWAFPDSEEQQIEFSFNGEGHQNIFESK